VGRLRRRSATIIRLYGDNRVMFFKLISNHTSYGGSSNAAYDNYRQYVLKDIQEIITGSITSTSSLQTLVFNRDASVITGSAPTSGIYSLYAADSKSYSSNDNWFQVRKYHHGKVINSSFNAYRVLGMRWQNEWGIGTTMGSHATSSATGITNAYPGQNQYNVINNSSSTYSSVHGYDRPSNVYSITGIVNDAVFAIQFKYGNVDNTYYESMVMVDNEYQPNLDDHFRSVNQYYCPTMYMGFSDTNLDANNGPNMTGTSGHRGGQVIGSIQNHGNDYSASNNSSSYTTADHMGYFGTQVYERDYQSIFPSPWFDMPDRYPLANGNSGYIMQPLMKYGRHGIVNVPNRAYHKDYKEFSMLRGMWRSNDNGFYTGERITDDTGRSYRAFRLHKCSANSETSDAYDEGWSYSRPNARSAVYLFPEDGQI